MSNDNPFEPLNPSEALRAVDMLWRVAQPFQANGSGAARPMPNLVVDPKGFAPGRAGNRRGGARILVHGKPVHLATSDGERTPHTATEKSGGTPEQSSGFPVTLEDWLERDDLIPRDLLLGNLLSTTTRALLIGPTGLGKTMFGLAVALAIVCNAGFLHWGAGRAGRVLYIDGEMPRSEMKRRLREAVDRMDCDVPPGLCILSREDVEDMPPLNGKPGQAWLDRFIAAHGPFDLIIFDNLQALLLGEMKEPDMWASVQPYVRSLTKRYIGQLWFHHTGIDESRGYGDKSKEWQLELVGLMERVEGEDDLQFTLKFTKARMRTPETREDFETVAMKLDASTNRWSMTETKSAKTKPKPTGNNRIAFDALTKALLKDGKVPSTSNDIPDDTPCVNIDLWRSCACERLPQEEVKRKNEAFNRAVIWLLNNNHAGKWGDLVWSMMNQPAQNGANHEKP